MYYSLFKPLIHTTPTKIKEQQIKKLSLFFLCSKPEKVPLLAKLPSFIYAQLLILSKSQALIGVTFTRAS
jgi:hypothetical protein